jgi:hypothetical protein
MSTRYNGASAALFFALSVPIIAFGQPVVGPLSSPLVGDDPDGTVSLWGDGYGAGADTWEDWLFVGAPRETASRDGLDVQDGAVYIYRNVGGAYVFQQKLTMPGSLDTGFVLGDRFGGGIEAEGGWLFVGAANDQDFPGLIDPRQAPGEPAFSFAGQVHVYQYNGSSWDFVQTLTSPEPKSDGSFGTRTQASHIAVDSEAETLVIGELNNIAGGVGQLHTYRVKKGVWKHKQSIDAPFAEIDTFGDDLVFAGDNYLVAGAVDISDDELTQQGYVFVYEAKDPGKPGKFREMPVQSIAGPVTAFADCGVAGTFGFGAGGLDAAGGVVAVADGCAAGAAGLFTGATSVYRLIEGSGPLVYEATIEGDEPYLGSGGNAFGSRHALAVSESGGRILIGAPLSPNGFLDPTTFCRRRDGTGQGG